MFATQRTVDILNGKIEVSRVSALGSAIRDLKEATTPKQLEEAMLRVATIRKNQMAS